MTAPSPKQRAVTMKRNGMDDSLVGAVLGLSAEDVRSLLYEADPDVELGAGTIAGTIEVAVPHDLHVDAPGDLLASIELDPGEYVLFCGINDGGQPEEAVAQGATVYMEKDDDGIPFAMRNAGQWGTPVGFIGGQVDPYQITLMALVSVPAGSPAEVEVYAYGPSVDDHLTLTRITFTGLKVG